MTIKIQTIIGLALALVGCATPFEPTPAGNPWPDDYTNLASMENYQKWGTYNVHDPSCRRVGNQYYMYSTDAIFAENRLAAQESGVPIGYIQMRRSSDLVNWEFVGWAFDSIPSEAVDWVRSNAGGHGATNIWAPYMIEHNGRYRLYYSVSAFGRKDSYIGLAESESPTGPWIQQGCVVCTNGSTPMNAIDPSVVVDNRTGEWWMHYGSYFGGLYCVQLNPETGLPLHAGDRGHLIARRANYSKDNLEAPEIIYNQELQKYFLFVSYEPLMTTYNVRVGRSDSPQGPFFDYNGINMADTTNNLPVLTAPYRFDNHAGWAGVGHCGVLETADGNWFMCHQGRLSPQNMMMDLHLRQLFFTADGWPCVSPERYAGDTQQNLKSSDFCGKWELITIAPPCLNRDIEAGQVLWGEGALQPCEQALSVSFCFDDGKIIDHGEYRFCKETQTLNLIIDNDTISNLITFVGHDWERETKTILFTGIDRAGNSIWGKKYSDR